MNFKLNLLARTPERSSGAVLLRVKGRTFFKNTSRNGVPGYMLKRNLLVKCGALPGQKIIVQGL